MFRWLDDLGQDLRLALRSLPRQPTFLVAVLVILAVGIGGNVAILSLLEASLLRPLPFREAERLVLGRVTWEGEVGGPVSGPDFFDYRERVTTLDSLAAFTPFALEATVQGTGGAERVRAPYVSPGLFETLGVEPLGGRFFVAEEGELGGDPVVVLAYGYWQRRFGGAETALGSRLVVDGQPHTVVGIAPRGHHFYLDADLWRPMQRNGEWAQARQFHNFLLVGRLARDTSLAAAQDDVDRISAALAESHPDSNRDKGLSLTPLHEALTEDYRAPLVLLVAAVALLLLVGCANAAGLMVARGEARRSETALRLVMGAGRERLVRQRFAESAVLALGGTVLGVLVAGALRRGIGEVIALERLGALETSFLSTIGLAAGLALVTVAVFGSLSVLRVARSEPLEDLRAGARTGESREAVRLRHALVVGQVALTAVLLVTTGLLVRSLGQIRGVESGFDAAGLLTAELPLPAWQYQDVARRAQLMARLAEGVRALPGVESVGLANRLPIRDSGGNVRVARLDEWGQSGVFGRLAYQRMVLPGFFEAMRIPRLSGRDVRLTDDRSSPSVVVLGESLAEELFAGESALGRTVGVDVGEPEPWRAEVIGVVGDTTPTSLAEGIEHTMYFSYVQRSPSSMRLVVRSSVARAALVPGIREVLADLDAGVPLSGVASYDEILADSLADRRLMVALLLAFSVVALVLSAAGLYGVLAYQVTRRRRDIGVRLALGAPSEAIARSTLRAGLLPVVVGLLVGLPAAWLVGRGLEGMLFEVGTADPATYGGVALFLLAVAALASWLPARRAARVDPVEAFRAD